MRHGSCGEPMLKNDAINHTFYQGKRVLVTGHTGFKGSWLCAMLQLAGAEVTGYALAPEENENLYTIGRIQQGMTSIIADIRQITLLEQAFQQCQPEIVIHLAAQPLVLEGYRNPRETYEINVMGTVNMLECVRACPSVRSVVNITTDKVYENKEWCWGYREDERLNGRDPYANSKSCADLLTESYRKSYFTQRPIALSTARAGNVIGGGDFAKDRIIPDCVRAARSKKPITLRHPQSIRPYQHVLEPLSAYLLIAQRQYEDQTIGDSYNVGPDDEDCLTTQALAEIFCRHWGEGLSWQNDGDDKEHEDNYLKLDCAKLKARLGWQSKWSAETAVMKTVEWMQAYLAGTDMAAVMKQQIEAYFADETSDIERGAKCLNND